MNSYYILDYVLVEYVDEGECHNTLKILRSREKRDIVGRRNSQSAEEWILDNEVLTLRSVFENGIWNIKSWESVYYVNELESYGISITDVIKITRVNSYELIK